MRLSLRIRAGCMSLFSYDCGFRTVRSALDCAGGHAFDDVALQEQVQDEDRQHGQQQGRHDQADIVGVGAVEDLGCDRDGVQFATCLLYTSPSPRD